MVQFYVSHPYHPQCVFYVSSAQLSSALISILLYSYNYFSILLSICYFCCCCWFFVCIIFRQLYLRSHSPTLSAVFTLYSHSQRNVLWQNPCYVDIMLWYVQRCVFCCILHLCVSKPFHMYIQVEMICILFCSTSVSDSFFFVPQNHCLYFYIYCTYT